MAKAMHNARIASWEQCHPKIPSTGRLGFEMNLSDHVHTYLFEEKEKRYPAPNES